MTKSFLETLASAYSDTTVEQAKSVFRDLLGTDDIELVYPDSPRGPRRVACNAMLGNVVRRKRVELRATFAATDPVDGSEIDPVELDRVQKKVSAPTEHTIPELRSVVSTGDVDPVVERVIRELRTQERRRDFIWAGFVVKDLLPSLGLDERESQVLFDNMRNEGMISLTKKPSPKNPDFSATSVQLNNDHPAVRRVLGGNGEPKKGFQPIPIRGEPLSATIIRERR